MVRRIIFGIWGRLVLVWVPVAGGIGGPRMARGSPLAAFKPSSRVVWPLDPIWRALMRTLAIVARLFPPGNGRGGGFGRAPATLANAFVRARVNDGERQPPLERLANRAAARKGAARKPPTPSPAQLGRDARRKGMTAGSRRCALRR
jgi:hypothetical protein